MVEKTRVLIPTIGNSNCARRAILYKKMILTFILWLSACTLFAQQISRIEDLQPLVKEEWRLQLDLQPTLSGEYRYAVLKNGVVTFSEDMQTLSCVGFEGRKLWEKPGIPARTSPIASPNGEYIHTYRLTGEEKGVSAIWAKDGDMLWQREGPFYNISPSSRFLVTYYSRLNPRPLEILDIRTGQTLWELEHASYWQAAVSENDRIVYLRRR